MIFHHLMTDKCQRGIIHSPNLFTRKSVKHLQIVVTFLYVWWCCFTQPINTNQLQCPFGVLSWQLEQQVVTQDDYLCDWWRYIPCSF